jgi:hypothetical protein
VHTTYNYGIQKYKFVNCSAEKIDGGIHEFFKREKKQMVASKIPEPEDEEFDHLKQIMENPDRSESDEDN